MQLLLLNSSDGFICCVCFRGLGLSREALDSRDGIGHADLIEYVRASKCSSGTGNQYVVELPWYVQNVR
jgi:hypothetical protein